ncbi:MAG TPA: acyl--CoA ligase family protein [Candidatus Binatia bacterium]|jgi:fatty-acyl-CoA synthase|nr:acyl--CoA ligase family protein [Candidatus Binatia bacterium]
MAVNRTETTPLLFLERAQHVYAERIGAVYGARRFTYAEIGERARRLAAALQRAGIQRGDRVAALLPNVPAMLEAHFGVALMGGVLVAINTRLKGAEVAYILEHSGARLLLADAELAQGLTLPPNVETVVTVDDPEFAPGVAHTFDGPEYEAFIDVPPADLPWRVPSEDDMYSINYTSGTTGRPKGVMFTHRGAYLNALAEIIGNRLETSSVFLWTLPMFHCNGWCFPWAVTGAGARHALLRKVDPSLVWQLVREEGVTHLNGAPTVLIMLINDAAAPKGRLERPLRVATGGAPPSPTLLGQWEAVGAELTHIYGLTETYGPHTYCDWHPEWNAEPAERRAVLRARQGVANLVACELRVVDQDMHDVPTDAATMGEVIMRGNNVMAGYFNDPEATATAFRGGWFHSGDVAVMHPDGYIELRDRAKDIIISGGENISTIEVEQAIASHPDVLEVAVIAVPDEKWGEVPKAFVVPKVGHTLTAAQIVAHVRERLAHFKCPKTVEFGELPKTSTGKVQKFVLREREWGGKVKRVN